MMWKIVLPVLAAVLAVGSAALVGGFSKANVSEEGVQNAINFSVVHHNKGTNDIYFSKVAQVIDVQKQVVSGMNYVITVKMAKTNCRKEHASEVCATQSNQTYDCVFTVWSQPWTNTIRMTSEKCQ